MALKDILPGRPLRHAKFQNLQSQDAFERVMTLNSPGVHIEYLLLTVDGTEYQLHYMETEGWHRTSQHDVDE